MELLIPGLILVALMVYASTRIKQSAARAFEAEVIEDPDFTLRKPEGFLHRINGVSSFAFEAYSKEFGPESADNVRAATAVVAVYDSTGIDEALEEEKVRLSSVNSAQRFELGGAQTASVEGELTRDGNTFVSSAKIIMKQGQALALRIEVLKELKDNFARKTEEMLSSFTTR